MVLAQDGFNGSWWTVDGGGGDSAGGGYTLVGTIGQHEAGVLLEGDGYTLTGGLWPAGSASAGGVDIYLPILLKDS